MHQCGTGSFLATAEAAAAAAAASAGSVMMSDTTLRRLVGQRGVLEVPTAAERAQSEGAVRSKDQRSAHHGAI